MENESFSFSAPRSFKKTADKLSFDYGVYSANFDEWPKGGEIRGFGDQRESCKNRRKEFSKRLFSRRRKIDSFS